MNLLRWALGALVGTVSGFFSEPAAAPPDNFGLVLATQRFSQKVFTMTDVKLGEIATELRDGRVYGALELLDEIEGHLRSQELELQTSLSGAR